MNITIEQAKAILDADPFVIALLVVDAEGNYHDHHILAGNRSGREFEDRHFLDLIPAKQYPNRMVTALCYLTLATDGAPEYNSFWQVTEYVVLSVEPFIFGEEEE